MKANHIKNYFRYIKHIDQNVYRLMIAGLLMFPVSMASGASQLVTYTHDGVTLEGYLAVPEAASAPVPGILIVHQWMGLTDHEKHTADMLAKEGYVAFACDIYGRDDRPAERSQAGKYAGKYKGDIPLYRGRLNAALNVLKSRAEVDAGRTAVMGYCFGGTGALELARSGADIKAAVSLHGGLSTPDPGDAKNIKATVLACHGGSDSAVPDEELMGFINEMRAAEIDWYVMIMGNSVHGFTHRDDPQRYNKKADERTWKAMMDLYREVF